MFACYCMVCGSLGELTKLRAYGFSVLVSGTQFSKEELGKIAVHTPFVQPGMFIL